jgi:transcription termination/antitermination protein NusA
MTRENDFDIKSLIDYVENQYGVDRSAVVSIIEESMRKSAIKHNKFTEDLRIEVDETSNKIRVFDRVVVNDEITGTGIVTSSTGRRLNHGKEVREGDVFEVEYPASKLGRICARECKMTILQKLKTVRNTNVILNYKDRIGDIVSGTVSGIEKGSIIFTVNGRTEMVIPRSERILKETYKIGDPIDGVIIGINEKQRNSPITVSRSSKRFLEELLRREVSEIADGTVEIMEVSRDPGFRSKILVRSKNTTVDPVGACVGRKGARINNIKNALSGERVDIVRFSDKMEDMVREALAPARVKSVDFDVLDPGVINVTVFPEEYARAVGKSGSNVRMASEIVGKKINVRKALAMLSFEEQKEHTVLTMAEMLSITKTVAEQIVNAGYLAPEGIAEDDEASFIYATGLDEVTGKGIYAAARTIVESVSLT